MPKRNIDFVKSILERVSFDAKLFAKELQKALKILLPYEVEELSSWFYQYTHEKPELRKCKIYLED
ncbi:hypothetical protein B0A78_12315 [Flavobacterium columnare NBRC 100251 = ATCC 23463]|uniref:Uncharacterized protein n=4 Tax=Flavobacterium TaxID=237 RepID=G8X7D7_FLACA|nr:MULTISPECIES: hypothetical protein [Flavobacterium]AEW84951.1 hypothetical protein FCOL_00480 [Flavobacterium columnare ATCC 49512]AMA49250.1 hypothetical protein AWN65_07175 [Flavobacterium covae]AMO19297.1 hypothetical protein UN65_01995 [Flavobacterium columnare]AND62953.1 hypothetical protein AX766_00205 [Flavobacterium covae]ANO48225.1 hypothetical protein Pf1_02771 [Flavobacterium columnare]